jgi:hypothetical protein
MRALLISLALVALAGCGDDGNNGRGMTVGTSPQTPMLVDARAWAILYSQNTPSRPSAFAGGGWYFDFPKGGDCQVKSACPGVHYVMRSMPNIRYGGTITVTGEIVSTRSLRFHYKLEPSNTCSGIPASARLILQKRDDNMVEANGRYWSNPKHIALKDGKFSLTVDVKIDQWSNVYGQRSADGLKTLLRNPGRMGLTFGGGCFFGHGVAVSGGTARFIMTGLAIN